MKFFAKAICDRAQIENRKSWDADGIELYLRGTPLWDESTRDLLNFASDNFKQVNLEIGDRISQEPLIPADLLRLFTVNYIRAALETLRKLPNGGKLIVHLAAHCEPIIEPPYLDFLNQAETRGGTLQLALEQVERLDPKRERILLENIIVLDWMDEETGKIATPPIGYVTQDFGTWPRVVDLAHHGITAHVLARAEPNPDTNGTAYYSSEKFGRIPFHFGPAEEQLAKITKSTPRGAVTLEIVESFPYLQEVHVSVNSGLLDGYGFDAPDPYFSLERVLRIFSGMDELVFVPELREETGDYVAAAQNHEMFRELKAMFR